MEIASHFSERSRFEARENALARAIAAHAGPICDLTMSNPTVAGLPYDGDAIRAALATERVLEYRPEPFGPIEVREAVARELSGDGIAVDPARVVMTASTSEAYSFVLKLLCDPGDHVLAPVPSYPLIEILGTLEGVRVDPLTLSYDGAWSLDENGIRERGPLGARAVFTVNPNNPTGHYVSDGDWALMTSLGIPVVSDEVFLPYELLAGKARTVLGRPGPLRFVLGGLSKSAALPQMKIGWLVVDGPTPAVDEALERLESIADAFLSASTPSLVAAPALLRACISTRHAIRQRIFGNLATLRARLEGSAASVLSVEGGWYAMIRVPETKTDEEWALLLLANDGVLVQPGYFYDAPHGAFLVVSLLVPEVNFERGAGLLRARVDSAT